MLDEGSGGRGSLDECGRFGEALREAVEAAGAGREEDRIGGGVEDSD